FAGALLMLLAALGLAACFGRRGCPGGSDVKLYALILVVAFVCSLGPSPTAWGHALGVPGPYALLLRIVPGLDGLRAAARLAVVVQMALAVLAAFGCAWLVDRVSTNARAIVVAALALLIVVEGWAAPLTAAAFNPDGPSEDREAYAYLKTL